MTARGFKVTDWVDPKDKTGEFKRQVSSFRDIIGQADASGTVPFPAEKGRYHLYVSYACPWATRTLIGRKLKGLEDIISCTVVHWHLDDKGWRFVTAADTDSPGIDVGPDPLPGHEATTRLRDLYMLANPDYAGRITVPVLWDKKKSTIVNNESSEILRMLNTAFDDLVAPAYKDVDLYPAALRKDIDATHEWQYELINNGVYKSGFATKQDAYERNVVALFGALDRAEEHLSAQTKGPFWYGDIMTEVDPVYVQHFKCNIRDIRSGYPYLHRWMRNLYWNHAAYKESTDFLHIKNHYTKSHTQINPFSIAPLGPLPDILPVDEEVAIVKAYGKL
ncbi:S-glutathionyl-(chloro)hydroquinone reductase [Sporothrix epigloea]|uniref:S-glutathionyl-(Chloro)hydroquinone reductase n=1 Tax=Sporothrix epigloea TaxID=1892477 RepID=A0ABP0E5G9_9PEZI